MLAQTNWPWVVYFRPLQAQHNLEKSCLVIFNSTLYAQQSLWHDYIKTLHKIRATSSIKLYLQINRENCLKINKPMIRVWGEQQGSLETQLSQRTPGYQPHSLPAFWTENRLCYASFSLKRHPAFLVFLVPPVLICEIKHLHASDAGEVETGWVLGYTVQLVYLPDDI